MFFKVICFRPFKFSTSNMSTIPKGSRVLVIGANGSLGSHIVNELLIAGYSVRGTMREESKGAWMKEYFGLKFGGDKLQLVIVPDMSVKGAYDEAVKGASGVVHVASNLSLGSDPNTVGQTALPRSPANSD